MNIAYFDCFSGAGGDMIVASLLDAGANADAIRDGLEALGVDGYSLSIKRVDKQGFAATRFLVELDKSRPQVHRHLKDIVDLLDRSSWPAKIKKQTIRVFQRLAEAEAKVHGSRIDEVHFHEVGAVDAIVDVAGAVLALDSLGVDRVLCSPIPTGSGTVTCEHGVMPVPAPATIELLKNVPLAETNEVGELITPTAAAVLTTLSTGFGPVPSMTVGSVGYGAGTRDGAKIPNLLRVMIGQSSDDDNTDEIAVLESNLDDVSPELVAHCMERLLEEGALDVYTVPIHMKKSRSGVLLTVLCSPDRVSAVERVLFAETTTFGIRRHNVLRTKMRRRHENVSTPYGDVRMKVGTHDGLLTASPEFEDCKAAAVQHAVTVRAVMAAANAAWATRIDK